MTRVTSIRVPDELLARLDRIARSLDRPRGWVIRQALGSYADAQESGATPGQAAVGQSAPATPQPTPLENVIAALEHMIEDAAERSAKETPPQVP